MKNARVTIASAVVFASLSKLTFAAGLSSFMGVGLGNTYADIPSANGPATVSSSAYRLIAGNQIGKYLSVEAEYIDLGTFTLSAAQVTAKSLAISGVMLMPMSTTFSAYVKAGLARVETRISALPGSTTAIPSSDAIVSVTLGYGVQADIAPNASLRLTWDRYKSATLASSFTDRIDMKSAALLIFRF